MTNVLNEQDRQTRFMVSTTKGKRAMFQWACEVLRIDEASFMDSAMKQAVLNALHGIEDFDIESKMLAQDARFELLKVWNSRVDRICASGRA